MRVLPGIRSFAFSLLPAILASLAAGAFAPLRAAEEPPPLAVTVSGVEEDLRKNVEAALSPPPGLVRDGQVDRLWLERFRQQAPGLAQQALEPFGYYGARIEAVLETTAPGKYRLVVTIEPGEPVHVDNVTVRITGPGSGEERLNRFVRRFPLHPGDVLRQDRYENAKTRLTSLARDLGYLEPDFSVHEIRVNRGERRAAIDLVMDTGPRFTFDNTTITGAPRYPERFLRRYLTFTPGETFSYRKLGQTQQSFLGSERFSDVVILPRRDLAEDHSVPVEVKLTPSLPKRFRVGAGYGTDTGARGSIQFRDLNTLRRGHEFSASLTAAERKQTALLGYIVPSGSSAKSNTALRIGYEREDVTTYLRRTASMELERSHAFSPDQMGAVYLRLFQESYTIGAEDLRSRMVLPGIRYTQRGYPNVTRPRSGYLFNLELRGTHQYLGSDVGLIQLLAGGNTLVTIRWPYSFFFRFQGGTTYKNEPLHDIPVSLRFFAGGDQSVRGYDYQSIGPKDLSGNVIGGDHLVVGSVEFERALPRNFAVAAFYDAGDAFNSLAGFHLFQGVGMGGRYYTAVGPIRLDVARQLAVPDPRFRIHVGVGFGW